MGLAVVILSILSFRVGSASLTLREFWGGLFFLSGYETQSVILYQVRLPRIAAAILAGIGLSVSGALLQSVTNNALASPNIIGVNSGAGLMVIVCLSFFPSALAALPLAAFLGAFGATMLILAISRCLGSSRATVLLAGIALTALFNAGISFLSLLDSDVLSSYTYFSIGSLDGVRLSHLAVPAAIIFLSLALCLAASKHITLLCLGESMVASLGVRVGALRVFCLACASAAAAAVVSFAGLLGFVGLVVPHIARKLVGADVRSQLVVCALVGAALLLLSDLVARVAFAPAQLPVGIVLAAVGAPFFLFLLIKSRREAV